MKLLTDKLTRRALPLLTCFALTASGCGLDHAPVASTAPEATFVQTADGTTLLTFSPQAALQAAKIADSGTSYAHVEQDLAAMHAAFSGRAAELDALIETTKDEIDIAGDLGNEALEDQLKAREDVLKDEFDAVEKVAEQLLKAIEEIDPDNPDYVNGAEEVVKAIEELDKGVEDAAGLPDVPELNAWRATLEGLAYWMPQREKERVPADKDKELRVNKSMGSGTENEIDVSFNVRKGSVPATVDIAMTVVGESLETLVIAFEPAGLEFYEPAELKLKIGAALIGTMPDDLQVRHIRSDGSEELATILRLKEKKDSLEIIIEIPGFSRYSPGGGW